ncbi:hypothetical protein, partial [Pannonibacter tanglangensis]
SARLAEDSAGVSREFGNGVMAITDRGYDSREGWTNLIPNPLGNGAVVGIVGSGGALPTGWAGSSVAGTGLTTQIVGVSAVNGLPVIRFRVSGTSNGVFYELNVQPLGSSAPAILPNTAYNASIYADVVSGTFPTNGGVELTQRRADQTSAVAVAVAGGATLNATPVLTRFNGNFTSAADAAFGRIRVAMNPANGQAVDVTFDLAAPQITQTAYLMPFGVGTIAPDALFIPASAAGLAVNPSVTGLTMVWRGIDYQSAAPFVHFVDIRADGNNRFTLFRRLSDGGVGSTVGSNGPTSGPGLGTLAQLPRGAEFTMVATWRPDGAVWVKAGSVSPGRITRPMMVGTPSGVGIACNGVNGQDRNNSQTRMAAFGA